MSESVAVLGAGGTMGLAMARNIAHAGVDVRGWNRTREKAEALRADGVAIADAPDEAAAGAHILLTMLSDTEAVLAAAAPALAQLAGKAVWLQMSTIGERGTERCAQLADEHAVTFIDAPVLGTKTPAEEAKLIVLASGPPSARDRLRPVLEAISQKTMWVGDAGAGTRLKMVVNSWVLSVTEAAAEALALAESLELEPRLLFEAIEGGPLDLTYLRMKGDAILQRDFAPNFRLGLAAKDARLIVEAAQARDLALPMFEAIAAQMTEAAQQHGDLDLSATYLASAASAG